MSVTHAQQAAPIHATPVHVRAAHVGDLAALMELEHKVFATDRLSRRSLRRLLVSKSADVLVAEETGGHLAGMVIVLYRPRSAVARLYSIAVAPHMGGRGIGKVLLNAAEASAINRDSTLIRLEVHVSNHQAVARYRKSGYREFGRHKAYYQDGGDALRFEKRLVPDTKALAAAPPYFHQTTEFTCGPACILMALAWADRSFKPEPEFEFQLWREATTIFVGASPGGCEPYGIAVTLKRHGLSPEIYVSQAGPYFLETAMSSDRRRVMELTQAGYRRDAGTLGIPTHLTPVNESVLMEAFDTGHVAIVLVSGYHMVPRGVPHWVFAFGRSGRYVLVHDPAAIRDDHGMAVAPETYAVPWTAFERLTRSGRDGLSAAIVIRKGNS